MEQVKLFDSTARKKPNILPTVQSVSSISSLSNPSDKTSTIVNIIPEDCIEPALTTFSSNISNPAPSISIHTPSNTASINEHNTSQTTNLQRGNSTGHLPLSALANLHSAGSRTTITKMEKPKRPTNPISSSTAGAATAGSTSVTTESKSGNSSKQATFKTNRKDKRSHTRIPMLQPSFLDRQCPHHSFHTDVTDVQKMEQGLVQLLDDFHSGHLQAFGKDCSFQKMERIRDQQEKLARLHFDLGSKQETYGATSKEGCGIDKDHISQLMSKLQELNLAIEELHPNTSGNNLQTEV